MSEQIRLNKYLAHVTGMSRREADEAINAGKVTINQRIARIGEIVHPDRDGVAINHQEISAQPKHYTYLLLNKPVGYVCSRKKQGTSPTIYNLLPRAYHHLKVAGRLDKDSCGLLLLTDDGDTIFKLTHPKFNKEKAYEVGLNKPLKSVHKRMITDGIELEDGISKLQIAAIRRQTSVYKKPNMYKITMHEGRNRQIRRTFKALGYTVTHLERTQFGAYKTQDLHNQQHLLVRNKYVKITT